MDARGLFTRWEMNRADEDVRVVRRLYEAWAEGDFAGASECFSPDVVWTVPGQSPIAGRHRGWNAIRDDFFAKLGALSGGSFRAELVDVAVGERHVVAVQHATAERDGKRLDITACQLMRIENGKIALVWSHYSDQQALDGFWS
jgi:uncharacterized protein (TIGR02246 family)